MYSHPDHLLESSKSKQVIMQFIHDNSFATLITGESISHLPFIELTKNNQDSETVFLGHLASANPHCKFLKDPTQKSIAIFKGPHCYISPYWYQEGNDPTSGAVPTWNYTAVHLIGRAKIVAARSEAFSYMSYLVDHYEALNQTFWKLPADNKKLAAMMNEITVFTLTVTKIDAKFKLSQHHNPENRARVSVALQSSKFENAREVGKLMTQFGKQV